jgi:hypothetical protein
VKHLVQRPLPDELLSSSLVRTCRHSCLPVCTVMRVLTNGRKWLPGFYQAGHLEELAQAFSMSPIDLLWRHTMFPYSTAFWSGSSFINALSSARAVGKAATGLGATTQCVSDHVRDRRFCARCAREDEKCWGESYWHRSHNLPGVLRCTVHGQVLRATNIRTAGPGCWSYALPAEVESTPALKNKACRFDLELARLSLAALQRQLPDDTTALGRPADWYRHALQERRLVSAHSQVSTLKLQAWARETIGGNVARLGLSAKEVDLSWLALMVRPRVGVPFSPLKHLVFEALLSTAKATDAHVLDHVPVGARRGPPLELDRRFVRAAAEVVSRYERMGMTIRVCDALAEAGAWQRFRHSRSHFPRLQRFVKKMRRSTVSIRPPKEL